MAAYLKTVCSHCGGHLEFPAEAAGASVPCPHCQTQTVLTISPVSADRELPDEDKLLEKLKLAAPSDDDPLQRSLRKLAILAGILLFLVTILIAAAAWLPQLKRFLHTSPPPQHERK